jgi:hypothetical protein
MLSPSCLFLQPSPLLFDLDLSQLLSRSCYLQLNLSLLLLLNRSQSCSLCDLLLTLKLSCLPFNLSLELPLLSLFLLLLLLEFQCLQFNLTLSLQLCLLLPQSLSFKQLSLALTCELLLSFSLFLGFSLSGCGLRDGTAVVFLKFFIL